MVLVMSQHPLASSAPLSTAPSAPLAPARTFSTLSTDAISSRNPLRHHRALRDDDDPVADVPALAVGVRRVLVGDQPHAGRDPRVLVDDHAIEHGVAADAEIDPADAVRFVLVVVGAEEDR